MAASEVIYTAALNRELRRHDELSQDLRVAHAWLAPRAAELLRPWAAITFSEDSDALADQAQTDPALSAARQAADVYHFAAKEWICIRYDPLIRELDNRFGFEVTAAVLRAVGSGSFLSLGCKHSQPAVWCNPLRPLTASLQPLDSFRALFDHAFTKEPTILATLDRRYNTLFSEGIAVLWKRGATREDILAGVRAMLAEIDYKPIPGPMFGNTKGRHLEIVRYLRLYAHWRAWITDHPGDAVRTAFCTEILRRADILSGNREDACGERPALLLEPFPWDDPGLVSTTNTVARALSNAEELCRPHDGPDLATCYEWNTGKASPNGKRPWGLLGKE